jgi:hypothetical protein
MSAQASAWSPFRYVTFDPNTGELTGSYFQEPPPAHEGIYIRTTDEALSPSWTLFRANAARDGVELAPIMPPPEPGVPQEVTRRQGIQALLLEGVTEAMVEQKITEMVADPLQRDLALVEFRASQVFLRQRPLVVQIGPALGLDLDALFIKAKSLT